MVNTVHKFNEQNVSSKSFRERDSPRKSLKIVQTSGKLIIKEDGIDKSQMLACGKEK